MAATEMNLASKLTYEEEIRRYLQELSAQTRTPGICLVVSAHGHPMRIAVGTQAVRSGKPMTPATQFHCGKINRFLLSLVVLECAGSGELNLDAPVGSLIPELEHSAIGRRVTSRHLVSETAGYRFADLSLQQEHSWAQFVRTLREAPMLFEPGMVFSSTMSSQALLAELVTRLTGEPAGELVRARIRQILAGETCAELGADPDSSAAAHRLDVETGEALPIASLPICDFWRSSLLHLRLSPAEVMAIVEAVMASRSGCRSTAIGTETARLLQSQWTPLPVARRGSTAESLPTRAGLGVHTFAPDWLGCNGPMFGQSFCFRYHSREPVAIAVGLNLNAPAACEQIVSEVLISLTGSAGAEKSLPDEMPLESRDIIGSYEGCDGGTIHVRLHGNEVVCELDELFENDTVSIPMAQSFDKRWTPRFDSGAWSLAFFREPIARTPCLMIGSVAYKRMADGARTQS